MPSLVPRPYLLTNKVFSINRVWERINNISRDLQNVSSGRGKIDDSFSSEGFYVTAIAIPNFSAMQTYN